jgi:hypothetical protein
VLKFCSRLRIFMKFLQCFNGYLFWCYFISAHVDGPEGIKFLYIDEKAARWCQSLPTSSSSLPRHLRRPLPPSTPQRAPRSNGCACRFSSHRRSHPPRRPRISPPSSPCRSRYCFGSVITDSCAIPSATIPGFASEGLLPEARRDHRAHMRGSRLQGKGRLQGRGLHLRTALRRRAPRRAPPRPRPPPPPRRLRRGSQAQDP